MRLSVRISAFFLFAFVASSQTLPVDRSADPCVDFYRYACGTWLAKNPIPADQARWGSFDELDQRNLVILRGILEKASTPSPGRDAVDQGIGDYYAACMDEQTIARKGLEPLQPELDRIAAIANKQQTFREQIARLHRHGVNAFFSFDSGADFKESNRNIAQASQGGLGLPDRDYYLKDDEKSVTLRRHYSEHIVKMFQLLGENVQQAEGGARAVMSIETDLAKASLDQVGLRDPQKTYHKMTGHELFSMAPFMDWPKYFAAVGAPPLESLNVEWPNFFRGLESTVVQHSLDDLKTYMRWHLVHSRASLLPSPYVLEDFAFFGRILTGSKEMRPRWKRCVQKTDASLGEALGKKYVDATFGEEGRRRTLRMVEEIEKALRKDIGQLSWMTPATKKEALVKLEAVANKIGYPDHWRDYSALRIERTDALGNSLRAAEFENQRHLEKIGKQVDRKEWVMTPPTVNAYYNPVENNINFPAGIMQPPFYDNKMDDAVNYGGLGAVVGHELTHGLDDQGRQFDPKGNLRDWWTAEDAKEFEKRADCFVKEYEAFRPLPDIHLNGQLTLGENTADNGGLRLAFMALMESIGSKTIPKIDGFTAQQRFFLGWGRIWCEGARDEITRVLVQINPHSPGPQRVNGVVSNMPEFQDAFACKVGQPMVRQPACRVW